MNSLVVGHRAARSFRITEALWDNPGRGRYRGLADVEPLGPVLVAVTSPQLQPLERTAAELALDLVGITPLRALGVVETFAPLHALVETEPAGAPLSKWRASGMTRAEILEIGAHPRQRPTSSPSPVRWDSSPPAARPFRARTGPSR